MTPPTRDQRPASPTKRVTVFLLTLALIALAIHSWRTGIHDRRLWKLLAFGAGLGLLFTLFGGRLPPAAHSLVRVLSLGQHEIHRDDDPRNLSPKIYLPILLIVIAAAVVIYYFYGPKRL